MASAFMDKGYNIISGGTDNHMMLIDLRNKNITGKDAENLFLLETLNAKNGNNAILTITLSCEFEGVPCQLTELHCVTVDDEDAATNNDPPYDSWFIEADFIYSEDCILGTTSQNNQQFSIHPNPVINRLFVSATTPSATLKIKTYTLTGKLISIQNAAMAKQASIDVSRLSSGIYFLQLEDEVGNTSIKKFVKK